MNKKEKVLLGASCFLAGAVAGFLIVPIKNSVYFGNNRKSCSDNNVDNDESNVDELDKVLDEVLDEVNEAINNATKEKKEEVVD